MSVGKRKSSHHLAPWLTRLTGVFGTETKNLVTLLGSMLRQRVTRPNDQHPPMAWVWGIWPTPRSLSGCHVPGTEPGTWNAKPEKSPPLLKFFLLFFRIKKHWFIITPDAKCFSSYVASRERGREGPTMFFEVERDQELGKSAQTRSCNRILRKKNSLKERERQTDVHVWLKALRGTEGTGSRTERSRLRRTSSDWFQKPQDASHGRDWQVSLRLDKQNIIGDSKNTLSGTWDWCTVGWVKPTSIFEKFMDLAVRRCLSMRWEGFVLFCCFNAVWKEGVEREESIYKGKVGLMRLIPNSYSLRG